ncbi:3-dehydroquinate dehydratase [Agrilactobacillus composti DSM 18527 = JCM 14202]|uniref:3-dehydroquinate dehydratase n=1 Tax=Agrilactobacillus composti DSM 18527 = JCM 14202 TaxID=1423734 RepID=X0PD19_9LACO|nr:type I 3-dehydroquinate dehydratase [Agrilactobacillus composti]KRM33055.1 3-dehydroquinate dehydratase [Agrilactobacillus composti DSM 18527 = JCM 14202]GAF38598.1 3-dehydroquinate dehydratase I [Agrilactobacillus composti DSM 18527 = JCM 14202]
MTTTFNMGPITLGVQAPTQVAVPITAKTLPEVLEQGQAISTSTADLAEWRLDYLPDLGEASLKKTGAALETALHNQHKGLLVTLRTKAQGGNFSGDGEAYLNQLQFLLQQGLGDALDLEWTTDPEWRRQILKASALLGVPVVLSHHDFKATPSLAALQDQLTQMATLKPALLKIAVMPQSTTDVLTILQVAQWAATTLEAPLAIMGMGTLGKLTRVSGNLFPSALTFATIDQASAPGQINLAHTQEILTLLQGN